ncbi:hypothetical protein Avbf_17902 [Armadillidium vulgare]|nr:hypothetical protein Avbf_17902 [Armadillidium vulgare]
MQNAIIDASSIQNFSNFTNWFLEICIIQSPREKVFSTHKHGP